MNSAKEGELMAKVEDLFAQGVTFWNQYRQSRPALDVELWDLDLSASDCSGINLSRARLPLCVAINANLRGADFREADLTGALLRGADLSGADLRGAHLWEADLSGADLSGADLQEADLRHANLSGATFREAHLREARLVGAILNDGVHGDADFAGANTQGCVGCPSSHP
jgi:uncharacterized protein YjbI with pentapeptide repeats